LRGIGWGALGAAAATFLAACGAREPQAGALAAAGRESFGADTGAGLDALRLSMPGSLANLYPGQESGILNYVMAAPVAEGLMTVGSDGALVPGLATGVERPDALTWVYTLDPAARFSDGTPVTASDVLASVEAGRDVDVSPSTASYWAALDTVKATGEHEVTFTTSYEDVAFGWVPTTVDALWVMPAAAWKRKALGGPTAPLLGSGPYKVAEFVPSSHLALERNEYWRGTPGRAASVRVDFISDDTTRLLAWQSGAMDISLNVPLAQAAQWAASPRTLLKFQPDRSYAGLTFNTAKAPFDDVHARRAVAHAIDKQALVDDVLLGQAQVATALATPEQFGGVFTPEEATQRLAEGEQYPFDLETAKRELAKSKTPDGFELDLSYPNTGPQLGTAALAFAKTLEPLGIKINVKQLAIEQWLAELGEAPQLSYMWYFNTTGDPAELSAWFLADGNPAGFSDPTLAALIGSAAGIKDPTARAEVVLKAQSLMSEQVPYLPLWWGRSATAFASTIGVADYTSFTFNSLWPLQVHPTAGAAS
jgi:peptide/nickel transport system substrate-binding protein